MRILTVLNRDGGTLKSTDLDAYSAHLRTCFDDAGHEIECEIVASAEIIDALRAAAADSRCDAIIAGGGDGTISAAAGIAWTSGKTLGVLPAGTLNLFARSLGVPLDIHEAAAALSTGQVKACDISTVNGRPFVHQFSVGMQPRVVKERDVIEHKSRLAKLLASARASFSTFWRPPSFAVRLDLDGKKAAEKLSLIAVSNNPYGEGHMPYADRLDGATLGVYRAGVLSAGANMKLAADLLVGTWSDNEDLKQDLARQVVLEFPRRKKNASGLIDGELVPLEKTASIRIHPGELKVIVPR